MSLFIYLFIYLILVLCCCFFQGGESFYVEFDKSLPDSMKTGWAEFGPKRTPVWKTSEGNTLFGKNIPSKYFSDMEISHLSGSQIALTRACFIETHKNVLCLRGSFLNPLAWRVDHIIILFITSLSKLCS